MSGLIDRIQVRCKQRRIRLEEFMRTYDSHHTKRITKAQFNRALDTAGMQLSTNDVATLQKNYEYPSDPSLVDYQAFCDDVNVAFTIKGLETMPTMEVANAVKSIDQNAHFINELSELEMQELKILKYKFVPMATSKGIVVKDVYEDFDRTNSGNVTKQQFLRNIFTAFSGITTSDADLIIRAYETELGVNYRALHKEIASLIEAKHKRNASTTTASSSAATYSGNPNAAASDLVMANDAEELLIRMVLKDRLRVKSFFSDYDRLRSGKCTSEQFKRGITLCFGNTLSQSQLEAVLKKYGGGKEDVSSITDSVNYAAFCDKVNPPLTFGTVEKTLADNMAALTESERPILDQVMNTLSTICTTRRILIKPLFRDFDKRNRGTVTFEQFNRVLAMYDLTPETELMKAVLLKYYTKHGSAIDFMQFCRDLDTWCLPSSSTTTSNSSNSILNAKVAVESKSSTRSVPVLMRYIKERVKRDRIRLEEYFVDYDTLRKGKITASQFQSGMSVAGFRFTPEEVTLLENEYDCTDALDSTMNSKMFSWKAFMDEIDSIFTSKGLEMSPMTNVAEAVSRAEGSELDREVEFTEQDEQLLLTVMKRINAAIAHKRLFIKPLFEDFDKVKRGYIPASKFERALSMFQLLPSDAHEVELIVNKFSESGNLVIGGGDLQRPDVNYKAFLDSLSRLAAGETRIFSAVAFRKQQLTAPKSTTAAGSASTQNKDINNNRVNLEDVLERLRKEISAKRIRVKDFLTEGDKLRTGEISISKFHTALSRVRLELDGDEIGCLTNKFLSNVNRDKVNWRSFVAALEGGSFSSKTTLTRETMDSASQEKLDALLQRIGLFVSQNRVNMKPYFKDYDRGNSNRVTKNQFASVLDLMKLKLSTAEVDLLYQGFGISLGRKKTNDVDYRQFIQLLEP